MANILRKKIALSTGVPPSIQGADQFWMKLNDATEKWLFKELGLALESRVVRREVLVGEQAEGVTAQGEVPFVMSPDADFGLSAIILSSGLAVKFAAHRMSQSVECLNDTSDLFLGLICEDPAMLLRESLKAHLTGDRNSFEKGIGLNLAFTPGQIKPQERYFQIEIELPFEGQAESLKLLFDFATLKRHLATSVKQLDGGRETMALDKRSLMHRSVQTSEIRINGVLERIRMSFGACSRLKVGQVLPLSKADQDSISIAVDTVSGSTDISLGKLGIWKQNKALKLSIPISEDFVRDLIAL